MKTSILTRALAAACALLVAGTLAPPDTAQAGGLGKAIMGRVLKRDSARDAATKAQTLAKPRNVHRYTSRERAAGESREGIAAGSHLTSKAHRGRPLSAEAAQRRFGLPSRPEVRETVRLPAGHPVRHNKALGGAPGYGEITSPKPLPKGSVTKVVPLR